MDDSPSTIISPSTIDGEDIPEASLSELLSASTLKWIFVGGKGGVGKTTTSCSIAIELAKRRETVLILSTDPAHNLSDAYTQKFGSTPSLVHGFNNLYAMEIDTSFNETSEFRLSSDEGWSKILPEMMQAFPGIDEALSFAELMQSVQSMKYSVIIFDTAPTGHTLRLLSFPDLLEKGLKKLLAFKEKMRGAMNMVNMVSGQSFHEETIHSKIENLKAVTTSVRETFQDPTKATFICVCIPEFLSVYETERLVQELSRQSIDCSNIVVNQVVFPIAEDENVEVVEGTLSSNPPPSSVSVSSSLEIENLQLRKNLQKAEMRLQALEKSHLARRQLQSKYLSQIKDLYSFEFHVVCMPQMTDEVRGVPHLRHFGDLLTKTREMPIYHPKVDGENISNKSSLQQ